LAWLRLPIVDDQASNVPGLVALVDRWMGTWAAHPPRHDDPAGPWAFFSRYTVQRAFWRRHRYGRRSVRRCWSGIGGVVFDGRGGLKILDFGIARLAQTAAARLTAPKTVIGSAPYLSPEQLTGDPADERSDLYALGCVMMTMLTERPPFDGEHPLALMHQHVNAAAPQLSERRPGIKPAPESLVAQLLSKSPQDRPQSALAVLGRLRDLEQGSSGEPSGVQLATTAVMAQATRPLPIPAPTVTAPTLPDQPRIGRSWWIAGGALLR
jgi:eukaryotic-like serine/threonine-protein kinase